LLLKNLITQDDRHNGILIRKMPQKSEINPRLPVSKLSPSKNTVLADDIIIIKLSLRTLIIGLSFLKLESG